MDKWDNDTGREDEGERRGEGITDQRCTLQEKGGKEKEEEKRPAMR